MGRSTMASEASEEEIEKICPLCQNIFVLSKIKDHIETIHLKLIMKSNRNEALDIDDEVDEEDKEVNEDEEDTKEALLTTEHKICPFCHDSFDKNEIMDHIGINHVKPDIMVLDVDNKVENDNEVNEDEEDTKEALVTTEQRICPFCHVSFAKNEIKDHIGIDHLKPIIIGNYDRPEIKEALLTSLGLNPKIILRKLTPEQLQDHGLVDQQMDFSLDVTKVQCDKCDKIFKTKSKLKRHTQSVHEGVKFPCKQCPEIYSYHDGLRRHMKNYHGGLVDQPMDIKDFSPDVTKFQCDKCDKIFFSNTNLKRHTQSVHEGVKFPCKQCPTIFCFHDDLRRHMKKYHGGLRFPCSECPKVFSYKLELRRHMKAIHEGFQFESFECELCSKTFSLKGNL